MEKKFYFMCITSSWFHLTVIATVAHAGIILSVVVAKVVLAHVVWKGWKCEASSVLAEAAKVVVVVESATAAASAATSVHHVVGVHPAVEVVHAAGRPVVHRHIVVESAHAGVRVAAHAVAVVAASLEVPAASVAVVLLGFVRRVSVLLAVILTVLSHRPGTSALHGVLRHVVAAAHALIHHRSHVVVAHLVAAC